MPRLSRRRWLLLFLILAAIPAAILFEKWREGGRRGGQTAAEPFRIAGNLYYVGASDITSFLITGPEGHILIDGGYPRTPELILASIKQLGFNIRDVKIILNSEPHYDHAGGLAELQDSSGAQIWASEPSAKVIAAGGGDEAATFPLMKILVWTGISRYQKGRVARTFKDGEKIRLGTTEITAHITPGHTRGCTTFTFPVREGDRELNVVHRCSLSLLPGMRFVEPQRYPGIRSDFETTFRRLRAMPADIWITAHAREFGRWRKFSARDSIADPVAPFIDRAGYLAKIDSAEARYRRVVEKQEND